jgi:hypothetical protein
MLCQYKDIFGKPNEGVHDFRIANIAMVDVIATVFVAIILHITVMKPYCITSFSGTLLGLFLIGIMAHRAFCVRTTVDKFLFPECKKK